MEMFCFIMGIIIEAFKLITGEQYVIFDDESLNNYSHDETEHLHFYLK